MEETGGGFQGITNYNSCTFYTFAGAGTQTEAGAAGSSGAPGGFGYGGTSTTYSSGGGSGWFGGGAAHHRGTGGGSGYIACPRLTNKHMAGFNVPSSSDSEIKTISLTNEATQVSETAETDKAKIGDGFARITKIN